MSPSQAVEANVREHVEKLDKFHRGIMSCRVIVEQLHHHHHQGNLYHVRVDLKVPGRELVVNRAPGAHHAHEDVYVAIRDAVDAMRRQLENHARRQRGAVKAHETQPHGRIAEIYPEQGYGRIETSDGRLVYFHEDSLVDGDFSKLAIGTEVRFSEEQGEQGPQATTLHVVGKHHVVE
jgi:ribosomal subunit interface protein